MLNAAHIDYQLTAETFSVDPVLSTYAVSFELGDELGNTIGDESGNVIGGDTNITAHTIKLTAPHIDYELIAEV